MTEPITRPSPLVRIETALEHLGDEHEPPPGWEDRVLAATAPRPQRWRAWFAAPVTALAAVLGLWLWSATRVVALALEVTPAPGGVVVRGAPSHDGRDGPRSAKVGEHLRVHVSGGRGRPIVWLYRDGSLVMRCPGEPTCGHADGDLDWQVDLIGEYEIVALDGGGPLPGLSGNYDSDVTAAREARYELRDWKITVR